AYAGGGGSLGFGETAKLLDEVRELTGRGYRAVKLRLGQAPKADLERVEAVRRTFGDELVVMTDANAAYTLDDARRVMPGLAELDVAWLEEPFPGHDLRSYEVAATYAPTPLALGENAYTRFEFTRYIESGAVRILQPDVGKTGGVTE